MFWDACSAMPVRIEPVRRRIQHRTMPSTVNGTSTPDTPCSPAHTSDEAIAAGQKPIRDHRPESRKPRIDTSSIHGAITTAIHVSRSTTAVERWCSAMLVVPWKPMASPSRLRSGEIRSRNAIWAETADPTRRDRARPTIAAGHPAVGVGERRGEPDDDEREGGDGGHPGERAEERPPPAQLRKQVCRDRRGQVQGRAHGRGRDQEPPPAGRGRRFGVRYRRLGHHFTIRGPRPERDRETSTATPSGYAERNSSTSAAYASASSRWALCALCSNTCMRAPGSRAVIVSEQAGMISS